MGEGGGQRKMISSITRHKIGPGMAVGVVSDVCGNSSSSPDEANQWKWEEGIRKRTTYKASTWPYTTRNQAIKETHAPDKTEDAAVAISGDVGPGVRWFLWFRFATGRMPWWRGALELVLGTAFRTEFDQFTVFQSGNIMDSSDGKCCRWSFRRTVRIRWMGTQ